MYSFLNDITNLLHSLVDSFHVCKLYAIVFAATEVSVAMNIMICKNDNCFHVVKINQIKLDSRLCFFLSCLHIPNIWHMSHSTTDTHFPLNLDAHGESDANQDCAMFFFISN
jgi:hypothetical protein